MHTGQWPVGQSIKKYFGSKSGISWGFYYWYLEIIPESTSFWKLDLTWKTSNVSYWTYTCYIFKQKRVPLTMSQHLDHFSRPSTLFGGGGCFTSICIVCRVLFLHTVAQRYVANVPNHFPNIRSNSWNGIHRNVTKCTMETDGLTVTWLNGSTTQNII